VTSSNECLMDKFWTLFFVFPLSLTIVNMSVVVQFYFHVSWKSGLVSCDRLITGLDTKETLYFVVVIINQHTAVMLCNTADRQIVGDWRETQPANSAGKSVLVMFENLRPAVLNAYRQDGGSYCARRIQAGRMRDSGYSAGI
jgi:hypothetical protein